MQYKHVQTIAKPLSRLVQGTMMLSSQKLEWSFALLDAVFELGCTTFDTGHVYGNGDCERTFGRWMHARGVRDQVVIIGKGAHHNIDRQRVTPFDMTSDLYDSLARFKIDSIDLYMLHRDDPSVPVGPLMEGLNEHRHAGRIGAIGASNWTHQRIQEANEYADAHGLVPFVASSPNFTLAEQAESPWPNCVTLSGPAHAAAREWYRARQMPVFAWSSLANGFFSGRLTRENFETVKASLSESTIRAYCHEANFKRLDRTQLLAAQKGMTVPQIALAYVMNQPLNVFALVGCHSGEEFRANLHACELRLPPQELAWLDLSYPKQSGSLSSPSP